jgi:hypothetical protein
MSNSNTPSPRSARRYAENTEVSWERSRAEIERMLTRYGADQFMYGTKPNFAVIAFRASGRHIRFLLPIPSLSEFDHTKKGARLIEKHRIQAREQAIKQRWRALALAIKAKLEAVAIGITQFEEEFYAHVVMPNGKTVYEETHKQVAHMYESGKMQPLLGQF